MNDLTKVQVIEWLSAMEDEELRKAQHTTTPSVAAEFVIRARALRVAIDTVDQAPEAEPKRSVWDLS